MTAPASAHVPQLTLLPSPLLLERYLGIAIQLKSLRCGFINGHMSRRVAIVCQLADILIFIQIADDHGILFHFQLPVIDITPLPQRFQRLPVISVKDSGKPGLALAEPDAIGKESEAR